MKKFLQKSLSCLTAWAIFSTPLSGQTESPDSFQYTANTVEYKPVDFVPARYFLAKRQEKSTKPKRKGTGLMVLGIVFTSITGATTLVTGALYLNAKNYNCDKNKRFEDDPEKGDRLKENRQDCYAEKKQYLNGLQTVGIVSVSGLALSIWAIVTGATQRSESGQSLQQVRVEYNRDQNQSWNLVFQHSW